MKSKPVLGVGINDADYAVYASVTTGGKRKVLWKCPFYLVWMDMLSRCYSPKDRDKKPTYAGCTVAPEWHSFSTFRKWMVRQDWEGNQIDKDLLIPGNKVYGPDACVFVSSKLNKFMTDHGAARGEWPIGVSRDTRSGKFNARCRNPFGGGRASLGCFSDPAEAHEAWRARKQELACIYAEQQSDPRIASAIRARYLRGETYHEQ